MWVFEQKSKTIQPIRNPGYAMSHNGNRFINAKSPVTSRWW